MSKQSPIAGELTSPTNAIEVPLNLLRIDVRNVRHDAEPDDQIPLLAASIEHAGLLQPLVVVADGEDFGVVAGRRRLLALQHLFAETRPDFMVSCLEIHGDDAIEASLAENYARKPMSTIELYGAFKQLGEQDPTKVAAAFGMDEARVARILRLAGLAPPIMAAWSSGELPEKAAQAYAMTDDPIVQQTVFDQLEEHWSGHQPHEIRSRIKRIIGGEYDKAAFDFVRAEYIEAGGAFSADLFSDDTTPLDVALVDRLASLKFEQLKDEYMLSLVRIGGGAIDACWVDEPPQYSWQLGVQFEEQPANEADAIRAAEIQSHLDNYTQELEELGVEREYDFDDDGKLWPEALEEFVQAGTSVKRIEELMKLIKPLEVEAAEINARAITAIPEGKGAIVLHARILHGGKFDVDAYYANHEAAGLETSKHTTSNTAPEPKTKNAPKTGVDLEKQETGASRHAFLAMQVMFADAVALEAEADAEAGGTTGLDMLLFTLARTIGNRTYPGLPEIRESNRGAADTQRNHGSTHGPAFDRLIELDWMKEANVAAAWDAFLRWAPGNTAGLGAMLLGIFWKPLQTEYAEAPRPKVIELLAEALDPGLIEWAARFDREKLLNLMSHKARVQMLEAFGLQDLAKGLKKATSTAAVVNALDADPETDKLRGLDAEDRANIDAWLPSPVQIKPVDRPAPPKPKAEKKPRAAKPKAAKGKKAELADA